MSAFQFEPMSEAQAKGILRTTGPGMQTADTYHDRLRAQRRLRPVASKQEIADAHAYAKAHPWPPKPRKRKG